MDALNRQVAAMTDEMQLLKAELIQIKTAHAGLHQNTVDRAADAARKFEEVAQKIEAITDGDGRGFSGPKPKKLIEPKRLKSQPSWGQSPILGPSFWNDPKR